MFSNLLVNRESGHGLEFGKPYLDAELVVEVSDAEHLAPEALGRGQGVHANGSTHLLRFQDQYDVL